MQVLVAHRQNATIQETVGAALPSSVTTALGLLHYSAWIMVPGNYQAESYNFQRKLNNGTARARLPVLVHCRLRGRQRYTQR